MMLVAGWNTLILACVASLATAEVFTSMAHLESTLYAEKDIAVALKKYIRQERDRLDQLEKAADDYEQHSARALQDPHFYLANPVNAFLLIKRFTLDWDNNIGPILNNRSWDEFNQDLQFARQDLPTFEDLKGAATALMRLQDTYRLDTSKVANGNLGGVSSTALTAGDCYLLGRLSYSDNDMYHTILWMQEALDLDKPDLASENQSIDRKEVLDYLSYALAVQGYVKHALAMTNELLTLDPKHERAFNNKRYFEDMLFKQGESIKLGDTIERPAVERQMDDYRKSDEFQTYEALCRGEVTKKIKDEHKLRCRYVHHNHPLLLLQPVKEEEMHLDPWIVIYHDILSDSDMNEIKFIATPRLNRATVQNSQTGQLETATYRISKSAWLKGEDHPTVEKVNRFVETVTGLDMSTAEELQIANYGLGGHYEPHFDFARNRKLSKLEQKVGNRIATYLIYKEEKDAFKSLGTGNRIATFLAYMTDVEAGGATVFPYLGLKLFPKKGAAAFWYNLHKNGDGIYMTRHAACPVLVGVKWVANKWIHERGQEFRRPCDLSPDE